MVSKTSAKVGERRRTGSRPVTAGAHAEAAPALRLDLALQGGGSHGAFTWGVLDALLEDGRFGLDGVSGTSAGAMNAAVLATGYARGLEEGGNHPAACAAARAALRAFWADIGGASGCFGQVAGGHTAGWSAVWPAWMFNPDTWPLYGWWDAWWKQFSPYQLNPLNLNPLRPVLERHVDIDLIARGPLKVFVTATVVATGQPLVLSGARLSLEALLASACLPQMFQAVEVPDDEGRLVACWDGGFAGNPSLWPLIYGTEALDVLLVQINPRVRAGVPTSAIDIADRLNEITFNASLVAELRAIDFVRRLIDERQIDEQAYKRLRLHRVADEAGLAAYDASSKLNTDPRLLEALFTLGRAAGRQWLDGDAQAVGREGTLEVAATFLARRPG